MKLEIYGSKWCHACVETQAHCDRYNIEYTYYDMDFPNNRAAVERRLGTKVTGIPVLFVDGKHFPGGLNELMRLP
jgi:glutaredoxin